MKKVSHDQQSVITLNIDHNTRNSPKINAKDTINYQNNTIKNSQNNMIINQMTVIEIMRERSTISYCKQ